jgi:sugar lactone lactonase YvrE
LILLAVLVLIEVVRKPWPNSTRRLVFLLGVAGAMVAGATALVIFLRDRTLAGDAATMSASLPVLIGVLLALAAAVLAAVMFVQSFGRRVQTDFPALDLFIVTGTLTATQLGAFPSAALGWDPLAYSDFSEWGRTLAMVVGVVVLAAAVGLLWNWKRWIIAAGIFAAIYVPLYTTLFTNPQGLATGLVGSLGYWLVQQGVQRGTQPLYYYLLIEIPVYEYLVALGGVVAAGMGITAFIRGRRRAEAKPEGAEATYDIPSLYPVVFGYWSVTALVLYTFAGERMPWLTVHIALPLIMLSGWAFGRFLNRVAWSRFREVRTWALLALVTLTILSLARLFGYMLGSPPPFGGTDLEHLRSTNGAITTLVVALVAGFAVIRLAMDWSVREVARLAGVAVLSGLYVLTLRASMRASFVNYDDATEFLVYAHSAGGPKLALAQIEELSRRTTGGLDIDLGYDNESTYPFWWYLRNYPNAHFFGEAPSRDIVSYPVVLAGQGNWDKVEAILRDRYYAFEYARLWWPMQDYFDLTGERVRNALTSPEWRRALWDVWFHRDYTRYGEVAGLDMSLRNWSPAEKLKLYVRKDVATQVWNYGIAPAVLEPVSLIDPYAEKTIVLPADASVGASGPEEGQFSTPRGIAVAPDGTLYVADTTNHRIQHLAADGTPLQAWGSFANIDPGPAPGGTFNEPWGVAVAGDGTVYVADTWNHRVQRFSPTGRFLGMWGTFGQAESQTELWGPRAVAVDDADRVYVADTGNKRIVVFDEQGNPLGQIGEPGGGPLGGQLAEPVGVAIGRNGLVYVADTWNSRIQVFEGTEPNIWQPIADWQLDAWLTDSLDNKPYLDVSDSGRICASDPDGFRVLCFAETGEFLVGWGSPGADVTQIGLPVGVAFDSACGLWVSDAGNDRLMHFTLPGCS